MLSNIAGAHAVIEHEDELRSLAANETASLSSETAKILESGLFITAQESSEIAYQLLGTTFAKRIRQSVGNNSYFLVVPTLRCDHDCGYCQVSRVPASQRGYDLNLSYIEKICRFVGGSSAKEIKIEFQGGEPLLSFDFLQGFVEKNSFLNPSKKFTYVVCSALGPLNDKIVEWARANKIQFSISLDGAEAVHSLNRPARGFNSYENTVSKIEYLRENLGQDFLSCVATISRNSLENDGNLVQEYLRLGISSVFYRPLSPFGFASGSEKSKRDMEISIPEFIEFYKKTLAEIIDLNIAGTWIVDELSLIHLKRIFKNSSSNYVDLQSPSGFVLGAILINYDGKIYGSDEARMLWRTTGAEELVLGDLDSIEWNDSHDRLTKLLSESMLASSPGCEECAYQPYCGSDPIYHLATQGDHVGDKSMSDFCSLQIAIFDHLFELCNSNSSASSVFQKWLNR